MLLLARDKFPTGGGPQNFCTVGKIGFGDSYLDSVFRYSKVFRLYSILHDVAAAVRLRGGDGLAYCYIIGQGIVQGPNCCLFSHVTGLILCLHVKIFLPSVFNLIDFRNRMSLIVLDIGLTEKNIFKELGLFIDGSPEGLSFRPPKIWKPNRQMTWNTSHLHGISGSSGKLDCYYLFAVL